MKRCPSCGYLPLPDATHCPKCGKSIESSGSDCCWIGDPCPEHNPVVASQVERDVVMVRAQLDYPKRQHADYVAAVEALDRIARKAHEADALIAQHELCGGAK